MTASCHPPERPVDGCSSTSPAGASCSSAAPATAVCSSDNPVPDSYCSDGGDDDSVHDPDFVMPVLKRPVKRKVDLSGVAEAVDAAEIGSRKASKVLSTFAASLNEDQVAKSRLQKALDKSRRDQLEKASRAASGCCAVFCDGRDDRTRVPVETHDGSQKYVPCKVHNVSVNMHPGDVHLGHFTCRDGHGGAEVARKLHEFVQQRRVDMQKVLFVGGDGTNQVTGHEGGWMAQLERLIGRPLGRVVCMCHQAELPFRALFRALAGVTAGPTAWTGEIGKAIGGNVHALPITEFVPVPVPDFPDIPAAVETRFSSDLRLLCQCARAVVTGNASTVADKRHGKMHQARWHTAQSRLLRLYMSCSQPSDSMVKLVRYVVTVYVPAVIGIRSEWDVVHAPRHLADQIRRQRACLSGDDLSVVQASVSRNSYMAHAENIMLAMLGDENPSVRADAVALILDMRRHPCLATPRSFRKPKLNFEAEHYTELTDLRATEASSVEPPYCMAMDTAQLNACLLTPLRTGVPNNTQSTERAVKLTTEVAAAVCGVERQDGCALNKLTFRRRCPGQMTTATFSSL